LKASYVPDYDVRRLRRLTRFRAWLIDMRTAVKNQVTSTVSKYNSNVLSVFTDAFGVSGRSFLKMLFETGGEEYLMKKLEGLKLTEQKRDRIKEAIGSAFKPNLDPLVIQFSLNLISQIEVWVRILNDAIAKTVDSIPRVQMYVNRILTVKGVGVETAQAIAAEIGDVTRFISSGSFVRYAGINPRVIQSGSVERYGPLEKCGSPYLRRALHQAANSMAFQGPENFQRHYEAVRTRYGEKRGHGVGVVSTSRKLARLIWSMLTNETDFIESPRQLTEKKRRMLRNRVESFDANIGRPTFRDLLINLDRLDPEVVRMLAEL
jgi:transposase